MQPTDWRGGVAGQEGVGGAQMKQVTCDHDPHHDDIHLFLIELLDP